MTPIRAANKILLLWQQHGPDAYPVDLQQVVDGVINQSSSPDRLNLSYEHLQSTEGAMLQATVDPHSFAAIVNLGIKNSGRRRFTLAHEIGHFVLHRSLKMNFQCSREMLEDFKTLGVEREANQFASQLLIPPNRVREYDEKPWNLDTLKEISARFEVSLQAAGLRATQLSQKRRAFVVSVSDFVEWGSSSERLYKQGCFFRQMMEVPVGSTAFGAEFSADRLDEVCVQSDFWGVTRRFKEESMLGYDGRIYTCIDAD
ncbi:ImmA/IrrE family metallo-endopeptidase [Gymnodinialimonas sp.]